MVRIKETTRLIPKYTREESDVQKFINACDLAIHSVNEKYITVLIKFVVTKLYGKISEAVSYKDTIRWVELKKH